MPVSVRVRGSMNDTMSFVVNVLSEHYTIMVVCTLDQ